MKPLPMPLRLAAGLVATAIEEAQELPRKLVELPVTAVSQVLQASMRMQQRVTELAIKGDQALGGLRPVPETPTWARFDEDEMDDPPYGGGGGPFGGRVSHPFGGGVDRSYSGGNGLSGGQSDTEWPVPPPRSAPRTVSPIRIARDPEPGASGYGASGYGDDRHGDDHGDTYDDNYDDAFEDLDFSEAGTAVTKPAPPSEAGPSSKAGSSKAGSPSKGERAAKASTRPAATKPPTKPAKESPGTKPSARPGAGTNGVSGASAPKTVKPPEATKPTTGSSKTAKSSKTGPQGHEDYPTWTLPQLRGRFRSLELKDVQALLTWETSHLDRPPYVTMLSNRIASITGR